MLLEFGDRIEIGELIGCGVLQEGLLGFFGVDFGEGMAAGGEDATEDLVDQLQRGGRGGDPDKVTFLHANGIVDQDVREFFNAGIRHRGIVLRGDVRPQTGGRAGEQGRGTAITS